MRVVILDSEKHVSQRAADIICELMLRRPRTVLGLATGGTPLGTYRELVARSNAGRVDFSQCTTFNLDEYVGLPPGHEQSYCTFMHQHLFDPAGFNTANCFLPDGMSEDFQTACENYEQQISSAGGIDLQLLGIGTDGHIAFNEPGSSLASRTRIKALAEQTRTDNARFFSSLEEVPRLAITMGIGTIMEAGQILLLATGSSKASVVRSFIEGPLTAQVPASILQMHPKVTVVLDEAAAAWLVRKEYYQQVEKVQIEIETGQAAFQPSESS